MPTSAIPAATTRGYDDSFKHSFKAFYDYIAAGDFAAPEPFPTFADGHKEIVLCEAILESHQQGGWVEIKRGVADRLRTRRE